MRQKVLLCINQMNRAMWLGYRTIESGVPRQPMGPFSYNTVLKKQPLWSTPWWCSSLVSSSWLVCAFFEGFDGCFRVGQVKSKPLVKVLLLPVILTAVFLSSRYQYISEVYMVWRNRIGSIVLHGAAWTQRFARPKRAVSNDTAYSQTAIVWIYIPESQV